MTWLLDPGFLSLALCAAIAIALALMAAPRLNTSDDEPRGSWRRYVDRFSPNWLKLALNGQRQA